MATIKCLVGEILGAAFITLALQFVELNYGQTDQSNRSLDQALHLLKISRSSFNQHFK
jgi:hypothetical protein